MGAVNARESVARRWAARRAFGAAWRACSTSPRHALSAVCCANTVMPPTSRHAKSIASASVIGILQLAEPGGQLVDSESLRNRAAQSAPL